MSQQLRGTGNQFRSEDEAEIRAREIDELKSEINRLEGELKKASTNHCDDLLETLKEVDGRLLRSISYGGSASDAYDSFYQDVVNQVIKKHSECSKEPNYKRIFEAACVDLGYINIALDLDPDAGGSVPIIEAIANKDSLIDKLTTTLEKANAQTEEFERRWYLVQDKVEELYTQGQGLSNEINDFQITIERQSVENKKLKGQQAVLIDLLRECLSVLNTIDGDDCHEVECLGDLELKCEEAIEGALQ